MLFTALALLIGLQDLPSSRDAQANRIAEAIQNGTISQPRWSSKPDAAARQRAFRRFPEGGRVILTCAVAAEGRLENCVVVSETVPNSGRAALMLVPGHRLAMEGERAAVVGGTVRFSLEWVSREEWDEYRSY